ncbi:MAG: hypothetical protein QOJ25_182 [Solirubrobacteraceae bacterium]|jgi:Na+/melibiose symporter-like transporter|nr:hypothetical protein [Solirubrobacteraceae bacterium]
MMKSQQDPFAYRIAIGAVGLALVAFLIGAAIIAAGGKPVPTQYWTTGSSISGALLGILAPTPTHTEVPTKDTKREQFVTEIAGLLKDLWKNRSVLILLVVFTVSLVLGVTNNSPELLGVAAAAGGALVGLLAPPPTASGPSADNNP